MHRNKVLEKLILTELNHLREGSTSSLDFLVKLADKVAYKTFPHQMDAIHQHLDNPDDNVYQMLYKFGDTIDEGVTNKLVINFLLYAGVLGWREQAKWREKYHCNIPWTILLDPTSACNLHCKGCWAADYGNRLNLSYDDIDSIITQGKEMGIHLYIYTGGEPLVRKKDIIALCRKHDDCVFLCFTNGTLIDQEFCDNMLEVGNFVPTISLEGNEETTDFRRGQGTYKRVINAMNLLRENHLPFGVSACYTSENIDAVSSDEFIDNIVDLGASFIWYFHYMPVGSDASLELMCTPEQREKMYHRSREIRMTKPIFSMDFQNDGQFVQGCIAGGRRYLHINAAGDVDPCVFVHFSDSNIHDMTLLEALRRPLFMAYYHGQPFNDNMLQPCPMLENPDILPKLVKETGAHSSNLEGEETAEMLADRCRDYAKNWAPTAEKLWAEDHKVGKFYH